MSDGIGIRTRIEDRLGCFGYFGFGGGYEMQRRLLRLKKGGQAQPAEASIYCTVCPKGAACWQRHRARVKELFADAAKAWDDVLAENGGDGLKALKAWQKLTGTATVPDLAVNAGNYEDGILHGMGQAPKFRGKGTLLLPLAKLDPLPEEPAADSTEEADTNG